MYCTNANGYNNADESSWFIRTLHTSGYSSQYQIMKCSADILNWIMVRATRFKRAFFGTLYRKKFSNIFQTRLREIDDPVLGLSNITEIRNPRDRYTGGYFFKNCFPLLDIFLPPVNRYVCLKKVWGVYTLNWGK